MIDWVLYKQNQTATKQLTEAADLAKLIWNVSFVFHASYNINN